MKSTTYVPEVSNLSGLWTSLAALWADWRLAHKLTASPHPHPQLDERTQKDKKTADKTDYDSCARPSAFTLSGFHLSFGKICSNKPSHFSFGGLAIKAEDLMSLGKDKGRELVRDHRLVYVYHDRIDMIGDKQASETKTFEAVAQTVQELSSVLGFIINMLNGSNVLVTADHGFIYQEPALDVADKSALDDKPAGTVIAKKRYLIGRDLGVTSKAWSGNTSVTAGTTAEGSLDFWVPKGASRFHFAGGARFVHGSAMPQEVVVPLITVRVSDAEGAKTRSVSISLLGSTNKVVTNTQRFEFIQTDAVSERVLARTVVVSLRDGEVMVSDEQSLTFDSRSQLLDERKRSVYLTVQSGTHDPHKRYYLVMRDAATKVEVLRLPIKVDLAFGNDF